MELSQEEQKMLDGKYGPGMQKCMNLLKRYGEIFGAEKMVEVRSAHISFDLPTQFIKEMSEGAGKIKTIGSVQPYFPPRYWREKFGAIVEEKIAEGIVTTDEGEWEERVALLKQIGFLPTWTCAPYLIGVPHRPGDILTWSGTSGEVLSNSLFGARANREGSFTALASAITGRTPYIGLIIKENRYAEILIKLSDELDVKNFTEADYGALGYFMGGVASVRNVALAGLPSDIPIELARMLVSPLPVSGACTMCHIIGVTPESPTIEDAFGGKVPSEVITVGKKEIRGVYEKLKTADSKKVDMVVFGCPHQNMFECGQLAYLLENKTINRNVRLVIGMSTPIYVLAKEAGYIDTIERAGGVFVNSCVGAVNPFMFISKGAAKAAATNSTRAAHYMIRMTAGRTKTFYGNMRQCVEAALKGQWEE